MNICVVGLGHVGLPTALILSSIGHKVVGYDTNPKIIEQLRKGTFHSNEDDLNVLYEKAVSGDIEFSSQIKVSSVYIIAVQTPYYEYSKNINLDYLKSAVAEVSTVCVDDAILVIESTIPPGTIDTHIKPLIRKRNLHVVHAPERVYPGETLKELVNNSRIIGADDPSSGNVVKEIYKGFCNGEITMTDIKTAEITKIAENAYRSVNIAYANELAKVCNKEGIDVYNVIKMANMHPRVSILQPGAGVGGHCVAVDPWFLVTKHPKDAKLIKCACEVNEAMPVYVFDKILEIMKEKGITQFSKIGIYGITYKENINDTRESPTIQLIRHMKEKNITDYKIYDPLVSERVEENQIFDFEHFLDSVSLIVIMVRHKHIVERIKNIQSKIILDTQNICPPGAMYKI